MNIRGNLERPMKPAVSGWLAFTLFSMAFVGGYFVVSYQHYLKTYQATQIQEIEAVRQRTEGALKQLKELLELTESLISATIPKTSSRASKLNQEARLREILSAVSLLKPSSDLPSLQKVAFYKLSLPQMVVTRFGIIPFVSANTPVEKLISHHWNSDLVLEEKTIVGRISVGKVKSALEGVLEIQINLAEFLRFLGAYQTIHFDESLASDFPIDKNHFPFLLAKKSPLSFWGYILTQSSHHGTFAVYLGSFLLLLGVGLYFFNRYTQKSYRQTIENLEGDLLTVRRTEQTLKATLSNQQRDFEVYTIAHQAQRSFHSTLTDRQKNQAKDIVIFLETVKTSHGSILSGDERVDDIRIEACLKQAHALSNGLWNPIRKDTVDLKSALKNLYFLFAEKLHQSNINLEMKELSGFPLFKGDSLLIDVFFINVVGKAIYRVPDNGTVSITAKETSGFFHLQIQDTGYGGVVLAEKLIQQSFSLFMEERIFVKLCKENGAYKKQSKSPQGLNITHLVIPLFTASEGESNSNVVQLFS